MAGNWRDTKLGTEVDLLTGFPFRSERYTDSDDGIRLIRGDNIVQGTLRWDGAKKWPRSESVMHQQFQLREGDVVLAMDRPWIEAGLKYARISKYDLPCLLVQRTARLRGGPNLDSGFLRYLVGSSQFTQHVHSITTGTAIPHISGRQIKDFQFLLPPLAEQKAIAAVLGALDDKIELNRRMNATLEAMARALFQSWFVDFDPVRAKLDLPARSAQAGGRQPVGMDAATAELFPTHFDHGAEGAVPTGWNRQCWGDIATLEYGKSIRNYRTNDGAYRVFGTNGPIGFHDEALCHGAGIVIGRKGAYRGVHYSDEPFFVIDTAFYLKAKVPLDLKWAYYELLRFDLNGMDSGSAIPSTSRDDFYGIPVIVPPTEIQDVFGRIVGHWFSKVFASNQQSRTLATLRDALLPKLLSGELRVAAALSGLPASAG